MCKELDECKKRGEVLAALLAEHLDDMSAENCEIPVETRGKKFVSRCEIEKPKSVACPDLGGGWLVGGVQFKEHRYAVEFAKAQNDNKIIRTPIAFHSDDCCGCAHFYFSAHKQDMIAICNECGIRRELLLNADDGGSVIGTTVPFREIA